jgi:ABC-2 type transport system permease protein
MARKKKPEPKDNKLPDMEFNFDGLDSNEKAQPPQMPLPTPTNAAPGEQKLQKSLEKTLKKTLVGGKVLKPPTTDLKVSKSSVKRMFILFKKTWKDIFKIKKIIITLVIMMALPMMMVFTALGTSDLGSISQYAAAMNISFQMVVWMYFWCLGIVFTIIISTQSAGLIADEVNKGTMLILISKPIGRIQIFLGKYLAVYLYGVFLCVVSIFLTGWLSVLITSGNVSHFVALLPFLIFLVVYSLFVNVIFVSISMALSSIMEKGRKVGMLMLLIIIMTYLGFFLLRMIIYPLYITYYLYWFDLGYHAANVYAYFIEITGVIPASVGWQTALNMLTSVYATDTPLDTAQGISLGGYELSNLVNPLISLGLWVGITVLLVFFGLLKLKKKEIS